MNILSDIIINHGDTKADIIIDGLCHYWDLDTHTLLPSAMALKTNSDVIPYVILLDESIEKKDSALLSLQSYCGKISNDMVIPINRHELSLITTLNNCLLKTSTDASINNLNLICEADIIAISYMTPSRYDELTLDSCITEDIHTKVRVFPITCKLSELDDMLLSDLDPLPLPEVDMFGVGTHLTLSQVDIKTKFHIDEVNDCTTSLKSSVNIIVSPPVKYYDDYLLTGLDDYTLYVLGRGI